MIRCSADDPLTDVSGSDAAGLYLNARARRLALRASRVAGAPPPVSAERRRPYGARAAVDLELGMPLDLALKRFKRSVERAGIPHELKRREYYTPPGEARRAKSTRARKRARKDAARRSHPNGFDE